MKRALEITTNLPCTVNCSYCPQKKLRDSYSLQGQAEHMSIDNFTLVLDKLPGDVEIHFSGFSEPFLNWQTIDMVSYALSEGHKVIIYTTGTGIGKTDISILKDWFDETDLFVHVSKNIWDKKVVEALKQLDFTLVVVGVTTARLQGVFPGRKVIKQDMVSRAGNLGFVDQHAQGAIGCRDNRQYQNVLLPNGDVAICCMDYGLEYIIGNLYKQEYEDLFKSDKFLAFLEQMKNGDKDFLCRKCFRAYANNNT